jgi:amidase
MASGRTRRRKVEVVMLKVMNKPSAFVPHDLAHPIKGTADGPLAGLTLAVKDMYDIAGEITGGGNPTWRATHAPATGTAAAVKTLLGAGATVVGKTICDEFFFSVAGMNAHYGTPVNPRAAGRIPGGSSSGSAVAVASGAADMALGSDTGGSVRVPATFNGIYGLRPTHGRVDITGAMAMAPTFDTVGWFTAGPGLLRKIGSLMLSGERKSAPVKRLLVARDAVAVVDAGIAEIIARFLIRATRLLPKAEDITIAADGFDPWREIFRTIQAFEVWQTYGSWFDTRDAKLGPGIRERIAYAKTVTAESCRQARTDMEAARRKIRAIVEPGTIVVMPAAPSIAPRIDASAEYFEAFRKRTLSLTCVAGLGGLPQTSVPAGTVDGCPAGISLLGWAGSDEDLLDLAVALAPCSGD